MVARRRKAFTLIELLVVIAIIGILAAMVFPVFARARESARKAVCLSNVKNIALAIQMYLGDNNDTLPPKEHRQEVIDQLPGISGCTCSAFSQNGPTRLNPYLRWAVVFDEYVKNRDVWRCPSAKMIGGAMDIIADPDWFGYLKITEGQWGKSGSFALRPCIPAWPSGWGGVVTDTILQDMRAQPMAGEIGPIAEKVFVQTVGTLNAPELKLVSVDDTVRYAIAYDGGGWTEGMKTAAQIAYPDICAVSCANSVCGSYDWENCAEWAADCGLYNMADLHFLGQPEILRKYTRHLGGVNLGFLDGHAAWIASAALLNDVKNEDIAGIRPSTPNSICDNGYFPATYPGVPTIY